MVSSVVQSRIETPRSHELVRSQSRVPLRVGLDASRHGPVDVSPALVLALGGSLAATGRDTGGRLAFAFVDAWDEAFAVASLLAVESRRLCKLALSNSANELFAVSPGYHCGLVLMPVVMAQLTCPQHLSLPLVAAL